VSRRDPIPVGVLYSASGTMAINETSLRDVTLMEIARVNAAGGLLGRNIEPVILDPRSDWASYRDMAQDLVSRHQVAAIFGCWTSISRKAVLPVVEAADTLLYYPVQYEGEEQSRNVFYLGATPNQQAIPALEYLMSPAGGAYTRFFAIGTEYLYPHATNAIIKSYLRAKGFGTEAVTEAYVPFSYDDWSAEISYLQRFLSDGRGAVISTINGDSNLSFYRKLSAAGLTADRLPVMALSVSEAELQALEPHTIEGHLGCWTYFMSAPDGENQAFIRAWQDYTGDTKRPVYDPMVGAMIGFRMWCAAVAAAGTTATPAVRQFMYGQTVPSLCGPPRIMGINHHTEARAHIGRIQPDGQFRTVWSSPAAIAGNPWGAPDLIAEVETSQAQRDLLDALPTPLIVLDTSGKTLYRSASTYHYFASEIDTTTRTSLQEIAEQNVSDSRAETTQTPSEIEIRGPAGELRNLMVTARRMVLAGQEARLLSLADVTYMRAIEEQLMLLNDKLMQLATTDPLTGVSNRRHFLESVKAEMQRMRRSNSPCTIFMLDLDYFKQVNDRFGHAAGDMALDQMARSVRQTLRAHDLFGRLGGEEFAGFLPETESDKAMKTLERVREAVAKIRVPAGIGMIQLHCSVGVTGVALDHDTPETALQRADQALYKAKRDGRDRVVFIGADTGFGEAVA
jgi:urea transport system substrate-binding protein